MKKLRSQLKEMDLSDMDPTLLLALFEAIRVACDGIGIHEGVVMCFASDFVKKPAPPSLEVRLSPKKTNATELNDKRLPSCFRVV